MDPKETSSVTIALIGLAVPFSGIVVAWIQTKFKKNEPAVETLDTSRNLTYVERLEERNLALTQRHDELRDHAEEALLEQRKYYDGELTKERKATDEWRNKFFEERIKVVKLETAEHFQRQNHRSLPRLDVTSLLRDLGDGLIVLNQDATIVSINAEASKIFKYPRMELQGKPFDVLFSPGERLDWLRRENTRNEFFAIRGIAKTGEDLMLEIAITDLPIHEIEGQLFSASIRELDVPPESVNTRLLQ